MQRKYHGVLKLVLRCDRLLVTAGLNVVGIDLFGGFTTANSSAGDARVYRSLGQGEYNQYTDTTKTAGAPAFEAGTNSYQVGAG